MTFVKKSYAFQNQLKDRTLFYHRLKSSEILIYISSFIKNSLAMTYLGLKFLLWTNRNF